MSLPSDGRRKKLIQGIATALRGIDGTADFFFDFSNAVYVQKDELEVRFKETGPVAVRVYDLGDRFNYRGNTSGITANMTVVAEFTITDSAQALVDRAQDVIADVELIMGRNPNPGGYSTSCKMDSIEPPIYDFERQFAVVVFRFACEYDFDPGVDR